MRRARTSALAGALVLLIAAPAAAMTAEEVVAKHIEAKGGKDAWAAIESVKATGTFTAFSEVSPFTLHKKRDDRYHLDHLMNARKVVIGHDGDMAWWENEWFGKGAKPIKGVDLAAISRDFDFATPFFDYDERGYAVELVGETEYEGLPAIGLKLDRGDESAETWYLDPDTYLEIARLSPGSDFGRAMEQRTFFDDFRDVDGVKIPHLTETQWYTRDRVMRIESIETNVGVDDAMFRMPAPPGMEQLLRLTGKWKVAVAQRPQPGAPWQDSERDGEVAMMLGGAMVGESYTTADGNEVHWSLSYDQFREHYRMTTINDDTRHMDIKQGVFEEDGRLVVSNAETGTTFDSFGTTIHSRVAIADIADDGFRIETDVSIDGGESWFTAVKQTYSRAGD